MSLAITRSVLNRLHEAFSRFFKQEGFPRCKSRFRGIRSFDILDPAIRIEGRHSVISVKETGKFWFRDDREGKIKSARVVRTPVCVEVQLIRELTSSLAKICNRYFAEDIKMKNLASKEASRRRGLNRSMLERQWGAFIDMLTCKAESAGGWLEKVNPRNTSRICHRCGGFPDRKLTLNDRECRCSRCGHVCARNVNASHSILERGISLMRGESVG